MARHHAMSSREGRRSSGLVLEWRETGGRPVIAPFRSGYRSGVIRDVTYELGSTIELVFAAEGVQCKFEMPPEWINDQQTGSVF